MFRDMTLFGASSITTAFSNSGDQRAMTLFVLIDPGMYSFGTNVFTHESLLIMSAALRYIKLADIANTRQTALKALCICYG